MKIAIAISSLMLTLASFANRVEVDVPGMTCGMCVESITKELKATDKAQNISVSLEDKKARFDETKGKKISDAEIKSAIKKAGYEAVRIYRK